MQKNNSTKYSQSHQVLLYNLAKSFLMNGHEYFPGALVLFAEGLQTLKHRSVSHVSYCFTIPEVGL